MKAGTFMSLSTPNASRTVTHLSGTRVSSGSAAGVSAKLVSFPKESFPALEMDQSFDCAG